MLMLITLSISAQIKGRAHLDSLLRQFPATKPDTGKVNLFLQLAKAYTALPKPDSVNFYSQQALQLAQQLKWQPGVARSYVSLGKYFAYLKIDYKKSENYFKQAVELSFKYRDYPYAYAAIHEFFWVMADQKKFPEMIRYLELCGRRFEKLGDRQELAKTIMQTADCYANLHNYSAAIECYDKGFAMEATDHRKYFDDGRLVDVGSLYVQLRYTRKARPLLLKAAASFEKPGEERILAITYHFLSLCADQDRDYQGAISYAVKARQTAEKVDLTWVICDAESLIGWEYYLMKAYDKAYLHTKEAITMAKTDSESVAGPISNMGIIYRDAPASVLKMAGLQPGQQYEKSVSLLNQAIGYYRKHEPYSDKIHENLKELSLTYERMHRPDDALKAYKTYVSQKNKTDSLTNEKDFALKEAQIGYSHKEDSLRYKQDITTAQLKQKKQQSYFFIGGIAVLVLLSIFIWLNFNNQRKSNKLLAQANDQLSEQREEITAQRDQLAGTLTNLKAAQTQLIQSEKMASLGELTAGIAHEIQNPLNFVNNFSEVSVELLQELKEEAEAGNKADVLAIADDLTTNLQKINHHGKRADFIVKGMLQHSRTSSGERQLTNINVLADEFLKLSYHGLRAKDKNFNAEIITNFDEALPEVNIVQQDIGRVLLNLFNNAFYAVNEKKKTAGADYKPEVTLTTFAHPSGGWGVKVHDNGIGISDAIKDKILQPFFTTKPTGQGTGLGLSLSYDIVVKGHGGQLTVDSREGIYSEFTVILPVS